MLLETSTSPVYPIKFRPTRTHSYYPAYPGSLDFMYYEATLDIYKFHTEFLTGKFRDFILLRSIVEYLIKIEENPNLKDPLSSSSTGGIKTIYTNLFKLFVYKSLCLHFAKHLNRSSKDVYDKSMTDVGNSMINNFEILLDIPEDFEKSHVGDYKPKRIKEHLDRVDILYIKNTWNLVMSILHRRQWKGLNCESSDGWGCLGGWYKDIEEESFNLDDSYLHGLLFNDGGGGGLFGVQLDLKKNKRPKR